MHIDSPQIVSYGKPNAKLEHHRQSFKIFQPSHIAPFRGWPRLELSLPSRPAVLPLLPVLSLLPAVLALALPAATPPGRMRPRVKRVAVRHGTPWHRGWWISRVDQGGNPCGGRRAGKRAQLVSFGKSMAQWEMSWEKSWESYALRL